ncbi:MAG: glycosyltransferase [bacterium]|nr:glycosyltransferase [bacterium]
MEYILRITKTFRVPVIAIQRMVTSVYSHVCARIHFLNYPHRSEVGGHDYENTQDFLYLPTIHSAKHHWLPENISLGVVVGVLTLGLFAVLKFVVEISLLVFVSMSVTLFYVVFLVFKILVVIRGKSYEFIDFTDEKIAAILDDELPMYTVFIPLLHEAEVIPQIIKGMTSIDYPRDKIEFLITLEQHDIETRQAIEEVGPPNNFRIITLPDIKPKSKPKALNVAFREARGEFFVIYDAEIIPDKDQLKKAYLAFKDNPNIACLQTRLDHYNANQNLITMLFNGEFSFHYDYFLPGLQKLGYPIPLSGHSTHFRKLVMKEIGAWDPYNVTEDCDVGIRLYRQGYETGILNSLSQEEATSSLAGWIPQRTRWMKGFIQTSLVHLRHPFRCKNELGGWENFFAFLLIVPGTVVLNLLNIVSWALLATWFLTETNIIQKLYPAPVLYMAVLTYIVGMSVFAFLNIFALYKRGRYELVKFNLLTPIYWMLLAIATVRAVVQIVTNPHTWEKTKHGSHLKT